MTPGKEVVQATNTVKALTEREPDELVVYVLRNTRIEGKLDLRHRTGLVAVDIQHCEFLEELDVKYCEVTRAVNFSNCIFHKDFG